jgi:hypothetical protein
MTINVIHNPRREDRKRTLDEVVAEHGVKLKYWPAVIHPHKVYVGIARAHKNIVINAMIKKLPMVCIAEDDFYFPAAGAWEHFLNTIPDDFDLYLGSIYQGLIDPDGTTQDFCGLTLYIIHERFYQTFLDVSEDGHIDCNLRGKGKYVVSNPFIALQHNGWSDNKMRQTNYARNLRNRKIYGK